MKYGVLTRQLALAQPPIITSVLVGMEPHSTWRVPDHSEQGYFSALARVDILTFCKRFGDFRRAKWVVTIIDDDVPPDRQKPTIVEITVF
jgi:hypothetical protein